MEIILPTAFAQFFILHPLFILKNLQKLTKTIKFPVHFATHKAEG